VSAPDAVAPKPPSVWEDFVDIFYAPRQVFERRKDGRFGLALVVLTVVMTALFFAFRPAMEAVMDAEFQRQMTQALRDNPQLKPEQLQAGRRFTERLLPLFVLFGIPIRVFAVAIGLWLLGKVVGSVQSLGQAAMVSTYALFPRVIESVLLGVQGLLMDPDSITSRYSVTLSVARFLDPNSVPSSLLKLAGQVDVFVFWTVALLGLGLAVTGRVSAEKAAIVCAIIWFVGAFVG
jgi:hypothetical protein